MKNTNSFFKKHQRRFDAKCYLILLLLSVHLNYSQTRDELFNDGNNTSVAAGNWTFAVDNDVNTPNRPGGFSWWANGGRSIEDLMMDVRRSDRKDDYDGGYLYELKMVGDLILQNRNTKGATWDNLKMWADGTTSHIESNGDENGLLISSNTGNKIGLGDANDAISINSKNVIMDYGGANDLAQVAINAGNPVNGVVLTIGGKTYIGDSKNIETHPEIGNDLKSECSLFVEKQILAADLNLIPKGSWKDIVFEEDYKKMDLNTLEQFVKENKHLPGVVSEKEVKENGYKIHEFNESLLQNVEELLLHIIDQNKKIEKLNTRIKALEDGVSDHKPAK